MTRIILFALFVCFVLLTTVSAQEQQFAELGDFKLESGETVRDCRVGYRTSGKLDNNKSNAILVPTWAGGTSEQLVVNVGPGKLLDSERFYVVAIDAFGNGVSSSPSNSKLQPRMAFPKFTLKDAVNAQHLVLTKILHLNHVKAVVGISMGGMQTFQWMVSYPDFMDKAIPIVGSPQLAPYDLLHWQTQIDAITNDSAWNKGDYRTNPARVAEAEFGSLLLTTPENYNRRMTRQQVFAELEKAKKATGGFDANDKIRQAQAMMALDVAAPFGGSLQRAAATVKAKVLVIVAKFDHVVTPTPALEFAGLLSAQTLILAGDCGHSAPSCEADTINWAVADFLDDIVRYKSDKSPVNSSK